MYTTKEQFDNAIALAIQKTRAQMASSNLYTALIDKYKFEHIQDLKFLADMTYAQGRAWVDKTFADFMDLHEDDPERWPMQSALDVVKTMRAYRKKQNAFKKEYKNLHPPTDLQERWIQDFGLDSKLWDVREWTPAHAILQNRKTGEIREIQILE